MVWCIEEELNHSIVRYFNLDHKIQGDAKRITELKQKFNSQSYHTRTETSDGLGIRVVAFRAENEVCNYIDDLVSIEERLKMKKKKRRYFNEYLHTLTLEEQNYLYDRYLYQKDVTLNETTERATIEEIHEIEDAMAYMAGKEPDKLNQIENGAELGFDELLDVLGV